MRVTLASYLAQAVQEMKIFKDVPIDTSMYMNCCDKFQVNINYLLKIVDCKNPDELILI